MRWYARPESGTQQLRVTPRLASWNKADDPDQVRLREYLDDTEALLAGSRIDGPWALRLDVGLPTARDLLNAADLDNYGYPLAYRLRDSALVSVWCTKQHGEQSSVSIETARELPSPPTNVLVAKTTGSTSTAAFKEQIYAAVAETAELPAGPVRLELAFVVGPRRNWLNLWKPTIDALDPILGRTNPDRPWHPRDGRIIELGMHLTVDPAAGTEIVIGINASQTRMVASPYGRLDGDDGHPDDRTGVSPTSDLEGSAIADNSIRDARQRPFGATVDKGVLPESKTGVRDTETRVFRDDDVGYLNWLAANPDGYVINIARGLSASAARVHRAGCWTINGQNPHKGPWTGSYVKVCAEKLADIEQWANAKVGVPIPQCGTCNSGLVR